MLLLFLPLQCLACSPRTSQNSQMHPSGLSRKGVDAWLQTASSSRKSCPWPGECRSGGEGRGLCPEHRFCSLEELRREAPGRCAASSTGSFLFRDGGQGPAAAERADLQVQPALARGQVTCSPTALGSGLGSRNSQTGEEKQKGMGSPLPALQKLAYHNHHLDDHPCVAQVTGWRS